MHNGNHYDEGTGEVTGWFGFLAGALIGAGVALLFASKAGTELRGMLRDYAGRAKDDLMDKGQKALDTAVERGKEYYDKGQEVVRDAGRSARELAKQGQEAVQDSGRSAKKFAEQAQDAEGKRSQSQ